MARVVPSAAAPGRAVDVTLRGTNLNGPTRLWTSFPGEATLSPDVPGNGQDGGRVTYRLTTPADTPVGVYGLRLATGGGVSDLYLFTIDDLPSVEDAGRNTAPASAQEIPFGSAVDGACQPGRSRWYAFTADAGQRVSVEVLARRVGSPLDPLVRLLDPQGREVAFSDDEPGLARDCRFARELASQGRYLLEVRDVRHNGGDDHRFRLRLGNFPLVSAPYPMGGRRGTTVQVGFAAALDGPDLAPLMVIVPVDALTAVLPLGVKLPGGVGSAMATFAAGDLPEILETEPNDAPDTATTFTLPAALNGRPDKPGDRDAFRFDATKGQRLVFTGVTRRLGSPTDLVLQLTGPGGATVAESDDAGTDEGTLECEIPADGTYMLTVEDLHGRGGPGHAYRVEARPREAGFALAVDRDTVNPPAGGVFVAKVKATRRGYDGPITLTIEPAGDGWVLGNAVIPEKADETVLSVTLPASVAPGTLAELSVVGTADVAGKPFKARAGTSAAFLARYPGVAHMPPALDGRIAMGVGPTFPDFFKLATNPPELVFPQPGGSAKFKVSAERLNGFDGEVALTVDGLPPGVTASVGPIGMGQAEAEVTLSGPALPAGGEYKVRVRGAGTFKDQPKAVELPQVTLRAARPFGVTAAAAGAITVGGKQKVKVSLDRTGGENVAVALSFVNLPAGVTAPAGAGIPEGATEAEVELTAAPDAPAGKVENVVVSAGAVVKGQAVGVNSAPFVLEVVGAK